MKRIFLASEGGKVQVISTPHGMDWLTNGRYVLVDGEPVPEPDLLKWGLWLQETNRHVRQEYIADNLDFNGVFRARSQLRGRSADPV